MSIFGELQVVGGSTGRTEKSSCKISYWHIPNGTDYNNAQVVEVFMEDRQIAEDLCQKLKFRCVEAMPMVLEL